MTFPLQLLQFTPGEGLLAGVVGAVAVAGGAARLALFPLLPRDLGGAPDLDDTARRFRINVGDGDAIDAWYLPGTRPTDVLVLHGYGREHTRAWRYASFLQRAGYGVLTVDFRSSRRRETGRRLPTTLGYHELPDARAALDWWRNEPGCRGHQLAVFGESLGGSVALMLAAEAEEVAALVVDCPFASGRLALEDAVERWARLPRWPAAPLARLLGRVCTGHDPYAADAVAATTQLTKRPVFFIISLSDNRFSPRQVLALWEAAGGKDPVWLVRGTGHNEAWQRHRRAYETRVLAFLDAHLSIPWQVRVSQTGDVAAAIAFEAPDGATGA